MTKTRGFGNRMKAAFLSALLLSSVVSAAWFGETATQQEKVELEFRSVFILFVYHLLYGTVFGVQIDSGLLKLYDNLDGLVLMNPPLADNMISNIIKYFIILLQPLYITAILATGLYLMLLSTSPRGRRRAKMLLPRLIASMVAATLSASILQLLFGASRELSESVISASRISMATIFTDTLNDLVKLFTASTLSTFDGGYIFVLLIFSLVMAMFLVLVLRYMLLLFFALAFPVGIFLYTFDTSRGLGRLILEQTIIWTFIQVVITIIIVVVNVGINLFGMTGDLKTVMGVTAFLAVIFSPFMIISMIKRFLP